ncbi:unnamed protein product [Adineta ricciae]|uniref:DNA helicase n=1 Tax=Adineta ricciae TaxID=249248 RepID=A0A816AGS2_ADIRI|nr:unnamed protein product [Adineta ricciae]CAF1595979.1 unnamed protein product [Adineta ricciae]
MTGVELFTEKCRDLLELEREEEINQSTEALKGQSTKRLAERGFCLTRLRFQYTYTGLYGRTILVFEGESLSRAQTFGPGDIAAIYQQGHSIDEQAALARGLIFRLTTNTIHITIEDNDDEQFNSLSDTCLFMIIKMANDVTYRRLRHCLDLMIKRRQGIAYHLLDIAFDNGEPIPSNFSQNAGPSQWFNENLDESQRDAVNFALSSRDISIIHGPPGTGKTTTIVEYILQEALKRDAKILCCAPSNIAVDNLVERLGRKKQLKLIRLGHPARLLESIQRFSLESIVTENYQDVKNAIREDLNQCFTKLRKSTDRGERERLKKEIKNLRKDIRVYEEKASREAMQSVNVILCTLTSATDDSPLKLLPPNHFDLVVIDECSQALEVACWLALLRAPRCVLAGDHLQLPPTILSDKAAKEGLAITLMQRLIEQFGDKITRMLTIQYRMNEAIMQWSSNEFYQGKLVADKSVQSHLLKDLENISKRNHEDELDDENLSHCPLFLIDTTGYDMPEICLDDENSRGNEGEVALVSTHVKELIDNYGVSVDQIGVITPYNMQVQLLRQKLLGTYPMLEIKSVDGFQGREKEVIIISMVRSNQRGEVGFLSDSRRINVAITRARRHLCVVCNVQTVSHDPFMKRLIDYMLNNGEVRSAFELVDDNNFFQATISSKKSTTTTTSSSSKQPKQQTKKPKQQYPPKPRSEATNTLENVLTNILDLRIDAFLKDPNAQQLQFEDGLSSFGRHYVHELAEKYDLQHISEGTGEQRHITVMKKVSNDTATQRKVKKEEKIEEQEQEEMTTQFRSFSVLDDENDKKHSKSVIPKKATSTTITKEEQKQEISSEEISLSEKTASPVLTSTNLCRFCRKDIPPQNLQLHEVYCQRMHPSSSVSTTTNSASETSSSKLNVAPERPKTVKKKTSKLESMNTEASFDELLEAARQQDNVCNAQRCKIKISLLGQLCSYCNRRYCFEHSMPEVHGCGHQARTDMRQTHISTHSNVRPVYENSTISKDKRPYLERKLQEKINSKETQRKKK